MQRRPVALLREPQFLLRECQPAGVKVDCGVADFEHELLRHARAQTIPQNRRKFVVEDPTDLPTDSRGRIPQADHPPQVVAHRPHRSIALDFLLEPQDVAELHDPDSGNGAERLSAQVARHALGQQQELRHGELPVEHDKVHDGQESGLP